MKNSLFKKLLAVSLALATVMFAGCQKDEPAQGDENPSENISQNVDETASQEDTGNEAASPVMEETIDLAKVDLTKYGLTKDNEISVPYPTMLGCVYVVRDYGKEEEQTYLFVTTKDKVLHLNTEFPSAGKISVEEAHSLKTADLDGEKGEEIVLLSNTGGNGGAGIYFNGIYKINNDKIVEMKISDEKPFEVTLEAPYTVIFKNEKFDYEEKIVCETDYDSLFDDNGNPDKASWYFEEYGYYDGNFYAPHEAGIYLNENDQNCVEFTSWSHLSKSVDQNVESAITYVYDSKTKQFEMSDASVFIYSTEDMEEIYGSVEEYLNFQTYTNGYTYYDINKDGVDEFITHTGTCEADRIYRVYAFADGKMFYAGEINGWHGTLYTMDKSIIVFNTSGAGEEVYVSSTTYELVDNKLVEKESIEETFIEDAEMEEYFEEFDKSAKEIEINNLYYK